VLDTLTFAMKRSLCFGHSSPHSYSERSCV